MKIVTSSQFFNRDDGTFATLILYPRSHEEAVVGVACNDTTELYVMWLLAMTYLTGPEIRDYIAYRFEEEDGGVEGPEFMRRLKGSIAIGSHYIRRLSRESKHADTYNTWAVVWENDHCEEMIDGADSFIEWMASEFGFEESTGGRRNPSYD